MKRVLVTGATGFLGRHFLKAISSGEYEITLLVRATSNFEGLDSFKKIFTSDDVNMLQQVTLLNPDFVFHFAAFYNFLDVPSEIEKMLEANMSLGIQILNATPSSAKFIYCGSYMQYLDSTIKTLNFYVATKSSFRDYAKYFARQHNFKSIEVILSDVYGPQDNRGKFLGSVLKALKSHKPYTINHPENLLSPLYIKDVINVLINLLTKSEYDDYQHIYIKPTMSLTVGSFVEYANNFFQGVHAFLPNSRPQKFDFPKNTQIVDAQISLPLALEDFRSQDL